MYIDKCVYRTALYSLPKLIHTATHHKTLQHTAKHVNTLHGSGEKKSR